MIRRIALSLIPGLLVATAAWAQLASQTALVGTVTDSGRARGARGAGRRRQRRHQGHLRGDDERGGVLQHPVRPRPARTRSRSRWPASRPSRRPASRSPATRSCARTRSCRSAAIAETVTVEAKAQVLDTDRAAVSQTIDERAVVDLPLERPQRLESGEHDARRARRVNSDIGLTLQGRRPARHPEQPDAGRHQLLVQPAGGDQHAPDRGCGDRGPDPDRQHVGRVRLVPRRAHQRGDQERHERLPRRRSSSSTRTTRSTSAATSRTGESRRIRGAATSSGSSGRPGR